MCLQLILEAKKDAFLAQICGFTILQETKKEKKPCEIVNLAERIQDQLTTEALAKLGNCNTSERNWSSALKKHFTSEILRL